MALPPPPPIPPQAAPPRARASWLALIIITAVDVVVAPFYFLMTAFSGHALLTGREFSLEGLFVLAMGAASLVCPIIAWMLQLAGGGRRAIYALALVPLAAPLLASVVSGVTMSDPSRGLIVTPIAK